MYVYNFSMIHAVQAQIHVAVQTSMVNTAEVLIRMNVYDFSMTHAVQA